MVNQDEIGLSAMGGALGLLAGCMLGGPLGCALGLVGGSALGWQAADYLNATIESSSTSLRPKSLDASPPTTYEMQKAMYTMIYLQMTMQMMQTMMQSLNGQNRTYTQIMNLIYPILIVSIISSI